jgi:hypothetical protein
MYEEIFNLNRQQVKNLADAHFGYAGYLSELDSTKYAQNIASSFLIAATLYALSDPAKSITAFANSANFYRLDQNPFWKIVAVCTNNKLLFEDSDNQIDNTLLGQSTELFAEMLSKQFISSVDNLLDFRYNEFYESSFPTGRLGLPIRVYNDAFLEMTELNDSFTNSGRALTSLTTFLNRAVEVTSVLQMDNYHWQNLKGTFIPVEPEVLAACISLCHMAKNKAIRIENLIDSIETKRVAKIPLLIARDIINNGNLNITFIN